MKNSDAEIICKLRQEYYALLPDTEALNKKLELEIQCILKELIVNLKPYQRIEVVSRIKECESAIRALERRQEGALFHENNEYSLTSLHDLVGVRILYFPCELKDEIRKLLKKRFGAWNYDPIKYADNEEIEKFYGKIDGYNLYAEYQIVPMLIGAFWDVEHSLYYKPHPMYKGVKKCEFVKDVYGEVIKALHEFEKKIENAVKKEN